MNWSRGLSVGFAASVTAADSSQTVSLCPCDSSGRVSVAVEHHQLPSPSAMNGMFWSFDLLRLAGAQLLCLAFAHYRRGPSTLSRGCWEAFCLRTPRPSRRHCYPVNTRAPLPVRVSPVVTQTNRTGRMRTLTSSRDKRAHRSPELNFAAAMNARRHTSLLSLRATCLSSVMSLMETVTKTTISLFSSN